MKSIKTLILSIAITLLALPAVAQERFGSYFVTGNQLLAWIDSGDTAERLQALHYIAAVSDTTGGVEHCAPDQVTMGQSRDLVRSTLIRQPQIRHRSAALLVVVSLRVAFPCATKGGTSL